MVTRKLIEGIIAERNLGGVKVVVIGALPSPLPDPGCDTFSMTDQCGEWRFGEPLPEGLRYAVLLECDTAMMTSRDCFP